MSDQFHTPMDVPSLFGAASCKPSGLMEMAFIRLVVRMEYLEELSERLLKSVNI